MSDNTLAAFVIAYLVCWSLALAPAGALAWDSLRAWRRVRAWRRAAPAREAAHQARIREVERLNERLNEQALASGSDERIILAGLDCIAVTYRRRGPYVTRQERIVR
jgi:hypothetical protein